MAEYSHGQRAAPHSWELSPLDLSIEQYEKKCKDYYYRKEKVPGETDAQRKQRLDRLTEAKKHLRSQYQLSSIGTSSGSQRFQIYSDLFRRSNWWHQRIVQAPLALLRIALSRI